MYGAHVAAREACIPPCGPPGSACLTLPFSGVDVHCILSSRIWNG